MTSDRSQFRKYYPLMFKDPIVFEEFKKEYVGDHSNVLNDYDFIPKSNFGYWSPENLLETIKKSNFTYCTNKLLVASIVLDSAKEELIKLVGIQLATKLINNVSLEQKREIIDGYKFQPDIILKEDYEYSLYRLDASQTWNNPFNAITYPQLNDIPNVSLIKLKDYILRGHSWFGVGEWKISSLCYLEALCIGLGNNNLDSVELITRCLVDTYIASENIDDAVLLASDFFTSNAYIPERANQTYTHHQILEGLIVGLVLNKNEDLLKPWVKIYKDMFLNETQNISPPYLFTSFQKWHIYELLLDFFQYKKDQSKIRELQDAEYIIKLLLY